MRIGILTVPFNNNYGGFLQAFALKYILTELGHQVIFINRQRNKSKGCVSILKRLFGLTYLYKTRQSRISKYTNQFVNNNLYPITESYYNSQDIASCLKYNLDCIVVGSDQVWRYEYAKESIEDFFLKFTHGISIKRISYAASFGTDKPEYPRHVIENCEKYIKEFDSISVRESSGATLLNDYFHIKNVYKVLDPTLLIAPNVYLSLINNKYSHTKESYIFTYILDENENDIVKIQDFAHLNKKDIIDIKAQTTDIKKIKVIEPVEKWLSLIYHADYVLTDSFHGTVFSILFHKPFIVFANEDRGKDRFTDLLTRMGLQERLIQKGSSENLAIFDKTIDWLSVESMLCKEKKKSYDFLYNALRHSS